MSVHLYKCFYRFASIVTVFNFAEPPEIIEAPSEHIEKNVSNVGLHVNCNAQGKPAPKFIWYKDGVELTDSGFFTIESSEVSKTLLEAISPCLINCGTLYFSIKGISKLN